MQTVQHARLIHDGVGPTYIHLASCARGRRPKVGYDRQLSDDFDEVRGWLADRGVLLVCQCVTVHQSAAGNAYALGLASVLRFLATGEGAMLPRGSVRLVHDGVETDVILREIERLAGDMRNDEDYHPFRTGRLHGLTAALRDRVVADKRHTEPGEALG